MHIRANHLGSLPGILYIPLKWYFRVNRNAKNPQQLLGFVPRFHVCLLVIFRYLFFSKHPAFFFVRQAFVQLKVYLISRRHWSKVSLISRSLGFVLNFVTLLFPCFSLLLIQFLKVACQSTYL